MHPQAYEFVRRCVRSITPRRRVCELGSCDVNGSPRALFPGAEYVGVDERPGPGVDVVCDAAAFDCHGAFDCVVCTEVLEHAPRARDICANAWELLGPGGVFVVTAATDPRAPHGVDGAAVGEEFYRNVDPADLRRWLRPFAFVLVDDRENEGDVYALAVKL